MNLLEPISALVLASLACVSTDARAAGIAPSAAAGPPMPIVERWPLAVAIGGGLNTGGHPTGEATFLADLPGPFFSLGYTNSGDDRRVYAEGGAWLILNLAAGVGRHLDSADRSRWGFHVFAGLPVPVVGFGSAGATTPFSSHIAPILFFVEPFYRPEFRKGAAVEHEAGVLLKVRIGLTKRQWSLPWFDFMAGMHDL